LESASFSPGIVGVASISTDPSHPWHKRKSIVRDPRTGIDRVCMCVCAHVDEAVVELEAHDGGDAAGLAGERARHGLPHDLLRAGAGVGVVPDPELLHGGVGMADAAERVRETRGDGEEQTEAAGAGERHGEGTGEESRAERGLGWLWLRDPAQLCRGSVLLADDAAGARPIVIKGTRPHGRLGAVQTQRRGGGGGSQWWCVRRCGVARTGVSWVGRPVRRWLCRQNIRRGRAR
jgi:hypothetical protein